MATFDKRSYQTWRITGKNLPQGQHTFDDESLAKAYRDQLIAAGCEEVRIKAFKSVKWRVRVRIAGAPEISRSFPTREKAEEWARAREGEIVKREMLDYRAADRHSLGDLLKMYEQKHRADRDAGDPDRTRIRKLLEHPISQWRMSSLTAKAIADYRDQRLLVVKGSTVRKEIELISRVIARARREWGIHLPANVASGALVSRPEAQEGDERDRRLAESFQPGPRDVGGDPSAASAGKRCSNAPDSFEHDPDIDALLKMPQSEQQALLRACRYPRWFTRRKKAVTQATEKARLKRKREYTPTKASLRDGCRMWAILSFAIETAMRRGEMLKLRWAYVQLDKGYLELPATITKNGKPRLVPLTLRARRILQTQRIGDDLVFATTADAIKSAFRRARHRVGSDDLRLHDLRHEATSRLFEVTDLRANEIGHITGHTDPRMLERYYNKRPEEFVSRFRGALERGRAKGKAGD